MSRAFKSRINQSGRALSLDEFQATEIPPEQVAARLRESEADRLAISDSLGTFDQDVRALETSRIVVASLDINLEAGRVEVSPKNINAQVSVDSAGHLIVRFGAPIEGGYSIHPQTQHTGQREWYFPLTKSPDVFILECRTNTDVFVNLNSGTHAVSIWIQR